MILINNFLDLNKYEVHEKIGEGSFSKVYKVTEKNTNKIYAAKISRVELENFEPDLMINLRREVNIMSQLIHPSIINFVGYSPINFKQKSKPVIITEFLSNGSLDDVLKLERLGLSPKKWNNTKKLINIFGIATAMSYLHSQNIIHRDLKPANILEDDSFFPKIADFGLSKKKHINLQSIKQSVQSIQCYKGSPAFMAPESFENFEYIKASDIYSFSIIVYEIMTLEKPYENLNADFLAFKVVNDYRPDFKFPIAKCYHDLITRCWSKYPNDRPSFDQIVSELKNNRDFLIDGIDENEFYDYVEMIDKSDISFLFKNQEKQNESSINKNIEKNENSNQKIVEDEIINENSDDLLESSPIFNKLSLNNYFIKLENKEKEFFKKAQYEKNQGIDTMKIKSSEINKIMISESSDFINTLKFFGEILIEIESGNYIDEKKIECISKWLSNSIKINFVISDIESIIFFLRNEKNQYKISLQSSFTSISLGAFSDCHSLTEISIPLSVTQIGAYAFSECTSLMKILIPSSVSEIGVAAFRLCKSLIQISIPSSITKIRDSVFLECSSLAELSIPSLVDEIGSYSFSGCSSLKKLLLPSSVKKIGNNAFSNCSLLSKIIIPSFVTVIENNTFEGCSSLNEISIPKKITKIGSYSFSRCSSLQIIKIPSSVKEIGCNAFSGCFNLQKIEIPSVISKIENSVFKDCKSLKVVEIPPSVELIEESAFYGCSKLKQIIIPPNVVKIEKNSFSGCSLLKEIKIPPSLTEIESNLFNKCSSLKKISLPSSITKIGWGAFNGCSSLKEISIPSSVTEIGHYSFNECSSLKKISIPSSVSRIENNTFSNCSSLRQIEIPSSVIKIGNNAFYRCLSLKEILIPSSVVSIGKDAFNECPFKPSSKIKEIITANNDNNSNNKIDPCSLDCYIPIRILGRGSFGKVTLVKSKLNDKFYAVKTINKELIEKSHIVKSTIRERNALLEINHPFLVSARYCFQTNDKIVFVLDYVPGGSLFNRFCEESKFSESRVRLYAAEIALAIGYLHKLGYIYRDLKSDNILIDEDGYIKLSDFGFTKKENSVENVTFCGTPEYISPEIILHNPYTKDVDWWSFGIVIYELLTGLPPFYDNNVNKMYRKILSDDVKYPSNVSPEAQQFIDHLLQKDPHLRLGSGDDDVDAIKNDPFFKDLDWDDVLNKRIKPEWIPTLRDEENDNFSSSVETNPRPGFTTGIGFVDPENQEKFVGFTCANEDQL